MTTFLTAITTCQGLPHALYMISTVLICVLCQLHTHYTRVCRSVGLYALYARVAETIEHMRDGICKTRTSTIFTVPRYTAEY